MHTNQSATMCHQGGINKVHSSTYLPIYLSVYLKNSIIKSQNKIFFIEHLNEIKSNPGETASGSEFNCCCFAAIAFTAAATVVTVTAGTNPVSSDVAVINTVVTTTAERTNGGNDGGGEDDSVGPVPVVKGLGSSDGDPLACSVRHHLRNK